MPSFDTSASGVRTPFGKNQYLRSVRDVKTESYTVAASTVTVESIDSTDTKVLQSGELMAKITSGADAGKIGPFQRGSGAAGTAAVNEVQTLTIDATGGTFTLTFGGDETGDIAFDATAAAVQAALEGLDSIDPGDAVVTGSAGGPYTITFGEQYAATDVDAITTDATSLTGGAGTAVVVETTPGAAEGVWSGGATDGRGDPVNIVGFCDTFVPWQLNERDVEVAVTVEARVVQAWCFERNAAGARIALTDTTRDDIGSAPGVRYLFS